LLFHILNIEGYKINIIYPGIDSIFVITKSWWICRRKVYKFIFQLSLWTRTKRNMYKTRKTSTRIRRWNKNISKRSEIFWI